MIKHFILAGISLFFCLQAQAVPIELQHLRDAYPDTLQEVSASKIVWKNGKQVAVETPNALTDFFAHLFGQSHSSSEDSEVVSIDDLKCDSYEIFFKKMYGSNASEVKQNLVTVYWMPKVFGNRYPLRVTRVNDVDKRIRRISAELEKLPPSYFKFLVNPGGSFYWRNVARERYLSSHSFGIAIDINSQQGNYWLWDLQRARKTSSQLTFHNRVPDRIVEIFEKEGFLWGGRWYYYDTMHFEYRPEMFMQQAGLGRTYNNQIGQRCEG